MDKSRRHEIGVGLLVLAALALLAYMSLKVGAIRELGEQVRVSAVFLDAAGLAEGAPVNVAGVSVGRVTGLTVEHDRARVNIALRRDAGLRQDALVLIRARSVLGEKYLEIRPQSREAPPLQSGDELVVTGDQVEIDELVNRLGPMVEAVDPQALSAALSALSEALAEDPERAKRMLADLETLLHNAAVASAEAPALMSDARAALGSVRRVADDARPVVKRADALLDRLDSATQDLPEVVTDARGLMSDARGAVADGRGLLSRLDESADDLQLVLANLSEIDKWELRRLLREEGIVVRLKSHEVVPDAP